jgi:hypothetical protein
MRHGIIALAGLLLAVPAAADTGRHALGMRLARGLGGLLLSLLAATASHAAGMLTPVGIPQQPIWIADDKDRAALSHDFTQTAVAQNLVSRLTSWSRS